MDSRLKGQLDFLIEIDKMKSILRQTLLVDRSRQENDAEHSWHIAVMAMTLAEHVPFAINLDRVIRMALIHDLVEVYAGDTFAYDVQAQQDKQARESAAADRLFSMLPDEQAREYRSLWEEFDAMQTPDSLYASAVDRLQPFVHNAMTDGHTWSRNGVREDQVYARMAVVREAMPALWEYVQGVIAENVALGRILPAPTA